MGRLGFCGGYAIGFPLKWTWSSRCDECLRHRSRIISTKPYHVHVVQSPVGPAAMDGPVFRDFFAIFLFRGWSFLTQKNDSVPAVWFIGWWGILRDFGVVEGICDRVALGWTWSSEYEYNVTWSSELSMSGMNCRRNHRWDPRRWSAQVFSRSFFRDILVPWVVVSTQKNDSVQASNELFRKHPAVWFILWWRTLCGFGVVEGICGRVSLGRAWSSEYNVWFRNSYRRM